MFKQNRLWIGILFLGFSSAIGCNAIDRAAIVCDSDFDETREDCVAGVNIANDTAIKYAREHRLVPLVSIPDKDELQKSLDHAYSECALRVRDEPDHLARSSKVAACESGVHNYVSQISYYNRALGQER